MAQAPRWRRWFADLGNDDVASVGGKNASLGEMFSQLAPLGLRLPAWQLCT